MDQTEPEIRHLSIKRVLNCLEDPNSGLRFIDLQTNRGLFRLHCSDEVWHALINHMDELDAQELSDAEERMSVPSILRFLNNSQKGPAA